MRLFATIILLLMATTADASIILTRMAGDDMQWTGVLPYGEPDRSYKWMADVYLTDDLSGGLVWLRSDYANESWVVNASPMSTEDIIYFSGEDMALTLYGDFAQQPYRPFAADFEWWDERHNPENYVSSLYAEGFLFQVAPGRLVPEPGGLLTSGAALLFVLILLAARRVHR